MATGGDALKRLGGGRWQTRDGRFTIEPQSGSWVVIDGEQADDLGMPLVRGPFGSLTAAREAIEEARQGMAPVSPLAARVEEARQHPREPRQARPPTRVRGPVRERTAGPPEPRAADRTPQPPPAPPSPPPPPEPAWIGTLPARRQTAARAVLARLQALGVDDAAEVARRELVDQEPALARLALDQRVAAIVDGSPDPDALVAALLDLVIAGEDAALGVSWQLVDGDGRRIGRVEAAPARDRSHSSGHG